VGCKKEPSHENLKNTIKYKKGKIMDPKFDKKINDPPPGFISLQSMAIHNLRTYLIKKWLFIFMAGLMIWS
jgi:hypothetical protein